MPCLKLHFLKDVCNEIITFGGSWNLKTFIKGPTTHALSHRYSNFGYDMKNKKFEHHIGNL